MGMLYLGAIPNLLPNLSGRRIMTARPHWHGFNPIGLWTLYAKEVRRFINVWTQTVLAPISSTLLFYAVFAMAMGQNHAVGETPFLTFIGPGLIIMAMVQNAFANTSSSLMISKLQGNIVDVMMPPISPGEMTTAYAMAGMTRGLMVGVTTWLSILPFQLLMPDHVLALLYFGAVGSLMLALIGLLGGIWADKFDHIAALTNFIVTPLAFLSGTFYSVESLPEGWRFVAHLNPFYYMIEGFRWGFIGGETPAPWFGMAIVGATTAVLWALTHMLFLSGYKLKA